MKHEKVIIHQPIGVVQGKELENEITEKKIKKLKKELYGIIADHSENSYKKIEKDSDRDYWMTSFEAKEYGMIDSVLVREK